MVKAAAKDFKYCEDDMPGASHKLIVTGEVECPTTGWKVGLLEASPPGINPTVLILQITSEKPTGRAGNKITLMPVRFEKVSGDHYKKITIRGGGPEFTIDVVIVH